MVMVRIASVALAIVLATIMVSSRLYQADAALPTASRSLTIVAFGSSSTQGVGASTPAAAYPAQLETMLRATMPGGSSIEVINRGVGGEDVDDMMERLDKDVIASRPDIMIWQTGSNDPLRHVPLDRFEAKTRAGIVALRNRGITVLLMEPQWCPTLDKIDATNSFRDTIRRIGAEMGIKVIRRSDMMHDWIRSRRLTMAEMLAPDGLHMRDAGYRMLAGQLAADIFDMDAAMMKTQKISRAQNAWIATAGL